MAIKMDNLKNDLNLRFCIWEYDDISHEDITNTLKLTPLKTYIKGKKINPRFERIAKQNGWVYGTPYYNEMDFMTQLDEILDVLEPRISILRTYAQKYKCEFSCAVFLNNREESTPWIHFGKRYNAFIKEIDVEFDIEIFYPPLEE